MSYEWLQAGWHKVNDPAWMVDGSGILGFWTRALGNAPNGNPIITYDWYRNFIQLLVDSSSSVWFAKVDHLWRAGDRPGPARWCVRWDRGLLRRADEHELPDGGH